VNYVPKFLADRSRTLYDRLLAPHLLHTILLQISSATGTSLPNIIVIINVRGGELFLKHSVMSVWLANHGGCAHICCRQCKFVEQFGF